MNLAVVDDLESDRNRIRQMLDTYFNQNHMICNITLFSSGEEFLQAFHPADYDAVFLDNVMAGIGGMETARQLRSQGCLIPVIFITSEISYALEGYTVQAMDYIVKPLSQARLNSVLDRLTAALQTERYLEIKENRIIRRLFLNEIVFVRSIGHFLEIHTVSEDLKSYMTLENFLSQLSDLGEYGESSSGLRFQSSCRGYVLNLDHVRNLNKTDFIMNDGTAVPVSRPKYKEMQTAYAAYTFARTRNCR